MVGIYKIISPSGKVYIGQSWNVEQRFRQYGAKHIKRQAKLFASFNKYGKDTHVFKLIHELPYDIDQGNLDVYEQLYMDAYSSGGVELLNIREGGSRGKHGGESLAKMKGRNGKWMIGRKLSKESIEKRTAKQIGRKMSDQARVNQARCKIGSLNPMFNKNPWNKGLDGFMKGRIVSEETRNKIGLAHKGKIISAEARKRMSLAHIGKPPNMKGEECPGSKLTTTDVLSIRKNYIPRVYTMKKLAKEYGVNVPCIFSILKRQTWKHI